MAEYLILAVDEDFLIVEPAALHPVGNDCQEIEGWGDYRMQCGETQVAVSFEDPGIQLIIEPNANDDLAEAIAAQITLATGRATFVVPL